eukprot:m51a1_g10267 hypothetical protein (177) ;mRNA; f:30604-32104
MAGQDSRLEQLLRDLGTEVAALHELLGSNSNDEAFRVDPADLAGVELQCLRMIALLRVSRGHTPLAAAPRRASVPHLVRQQTGKDALLQLLGDITAEISAVRQLVSSSDHSELTGARGDSSESPVDLAEVERQCVRMVAALRVTKSLAPLSTAAHKPPFLARRQPRSAFAQKQCTV